MSETIVDPRGAGRPVGRSDNLTAPRIVHHFGPRIGEEGGGGMASVLAAYAHLPLQRYSVRFTASATLHTRFKSLERLLPSVLALLRTSTRSQCPVVHVHLADRGSLVREGGLLRMSRMLGLPTVATMHASQLEQEVRTNPRRLRQVLRSAHVIHSLGEKSAALMRDVVGHDVDISVLPNCVLLRESVAPAGSCPPRVVFAGEVSARKGADVLFDAWPRVVAAVPGAELVVLGKPRDIPIPSLRGLTFAGAVLRERVLAELDGCRVAVLPSRAETQPMFVLEAMSAGRPVITTPIAEIPSTIAEPEGLVPVGDADALARALIGYLTDAERATSAGWRGRHKVEEQFSTTRVAARFEELYDKAVARCTAAQH
ncbi:glycosyltransferase family 4 protein [Saccharopolyspora sp. NPDC002376]